MNKNTKHSWICPECKDASKKYSAKNLCKTCYQRMRRRKLGMKPRRYWGKYKECRLCGTKPIKARGLCNKCYDLILERKNKKIRDIQKYRAGMKQRFGGNLEDILIIANYECNECGMKDSQSLELWNRHLDIHHKDGKGRTSQHPNHNRNNLIVLCRNCHMLLHHPKGAKIGREVLKCV